MSTGQRKSGKQHTLCHGCGKWIDAKEAHYFEDESSLCPACDPVPPEDALPLPPEGGRAMSTELKPCPFCGGTAQMVSCMGSWRPGGYEPDGRRVVCSALFCSGSGKPFYGEGMEEQAAVWWNSRAPDATLSQDVERLAADNLMWRRARRDAEIRAEAAEAEVTRLTAERDAALERVGVLEEALGPFEDLGHLLEVETEGFQDADTFDLTHGGHLIAALTFGDFRRAHAALHHKEG